MAPDLRDPEIEVSDGEDTTIDTVDITVIDSDTTYLLNESFDDGNYSGWSLVDQGTRYGPMAWSAASGTMVQSSNVITDPTIGSDIPKLGTYAWYPVRINGTYKFFAFHKSLKIMYFVGTKC